MSFSLDNPPPPPPDDLPAGWSCLQTATNLQYRDGTGQVNTMLPYQDSPFHSESGQMSSSNSAVAGQPAAQSGSPLPMLRPSDRELERPKTPTSLKRRLDPSIASIPPPPKKSPGAAEWTLSEKAIAELTSELQALKNGLQTLTVITKLFDNLKFLNAGLTGDLEKHDRMCVSFLHVKELHLCLIGWEEKTGLVYLEDRHGNRTPYDVFEPDDRTALLEQLRGWYYGALEEPMDEDDWMRCPPDSGFRYAAKRICHRVTTRPRRGPEKRGPSPLRTSVGAVD